MSRVRRQARASLGALVCSAIVALAAPAAAAPPPLSADGSQADFASSYGSGNFGRWSVDEFGLPFFNYEIDQLTDPRAQQPELNGATRAQHQLGNDHIIATAWNDGYTQLWSQDRLPQWANAYEPNYRHYAGGYGYLNVDGKVLSTFWEDRPQGASLDRDFGLGYYRKSLRAEGLELRDEVYAPFGDDPLLLHEVSIRNTSDRTRDVSWFEYWDVNPRVQPSTGARPNRGVGAPRWNPDTRTLTVEQNPDSGDLWPMSIFATPIEGPLDGFETTIGGFFGSGTRAEPAAVAADHLAGGIAPPAPVGQASQTLFAFRAPLRLEPGESATLRYAYGMAHPGEVDGLVAKYRAAPDPFGSSQRSWADWIPKADFGAGYRWVARELAWDAYLLRTASVFEEECGHHTITQGGYYQYSLGHNLGYRSWLHYLLPITYTEPELAREILRYAIKLQPEISNENPYGIGPLCTRFDLGTSSDLDFWLLLAAGEYGLGSRDTDFFDEPLSFYDTKREVSAWEHIKLAYRHQESLRGPNGVYRMGATGDWSDFATELGPMTETTLVAAQLAYAYPKLAELAELRGDEEFARELRTRAAELQEVMDGEWTGKGWYSRGYFGTRQIGKGMPFGEPQPWAILAGVPSNEQAITLVANIRRFLTGHGAPDGPTKIGSAMAPARDDPDITERGPVIDPTEDGSLPDPVGLALEDVPNAPLAGAAAYPGGVWYDINGWLTWALGSLDGVVPNARALAWDEYTRNTLAAHATAFPDHWDGTISVDDVCNAWYSSDPSRCGIGVFTWNGQITEQATWMVMGAIRLAGVTPTRRGFDVEPHLPFDRFSLRLPQVGVASEPGSRRGYFRVEESGTLRLRVAPPEDANPARLVAYAEGAKVPYSLEDGLVVFELPAVADEAADWAVVAPGR
jgi:hypothetical protein